MIVGTISQGPGSLPDVLMLTRFAGDEVDYVVGSARNVTSYSKGLVVSGAAECRAGRQVVADAAAGAVARKASVSSDQVEIIML